jgi:acetamidase/formamidase
LRTTVSTSRLTPWAAPAASFIRRRSRRKTDCWSGSSGTTIEQIKKTRTDFPGRGPHTLTGPIYIEEAQPGDVLKVTLNKIVPRAYATNFNVPGMFGQFPTSIRTARSNISISTSTRCRPSSCPAS